MESIDEDDFGYCEECDIDIGIRRLEARPTATLCIDCKTLSEIKEKQKRQIKDLSQQFTGSAFMYIGRFAPSPTGHLHFGSLLAALASYLDAKSNQGLWRLRIDDLDPPRELPGAANSIIDTLIAYGLEWDKEVVYQSHNHSNYHKALLQLQQNPTCLPLQLLAKTNYSTHQQSPL